ncbi:protein of unknown function [Azospirillum lipoferum 4B]|uniref:Uncharacterized protein n=1 Tax=Azospirillum lipoferum (strain 4B) TaxID=862719 RepID=G7Z9D9_AZOL4|nr:protein of unknown function [Azospirillum lipoferum 4B]
MSAPPENPPPVRFRIPLDEKRLEQAAPVDAASRRAGGGATGGIRECVRLPAGGAAC